MIGCLFRMIRLGVVAVLLVTAFVVFGGQDAQAQDIIPGDIGDCKQAPTPERPGTGIGGWLDGKPEKPIAAADPFAADATTSVYEQYGWAGLRWDTYDLGCGGSARDPGAAGGSAFGNFIMVAPKMLGAATVAVSRWAYAPESWIGVLDPLVITMQSALRESFYDPWIGAALVALGVLLMWKARKAHLAGTLTAVAVALFVLVASAALFSYPLQAARIADQTVPAVLGPINAGASGISSSGDPVGKVASNLHRVAYDQKIMGLLGDATSPTAEKYGPDLFRATALTWTEDALTGEARKDMIEAKADLWDQTAEKVKDEDPDAYLYLTGKRAEARPEAAGIATFGMLVAVPFPIISGLLIMVAFLIFRLAVMVAPLLLVLAVFPPFLGMALGALRVAAAALANVIAFGIGSAVAVASIVVLLDPETALPAPVALLLVAVVGIVLWLVLKPFRRLTAMVSNSDPFRDATGGVGDRARSVGKGALKMGLAAAAPGAGAYLGTREALEDDRDEQEEAATKRAESESRPQELPPEGEPAPTVPLVAATAARPHGAGSADAQHTLPPADSTPEMRAAEAEELARRAARQQGVPLPGAVALDPAAIPAEPEQGALSAAPVPLALGTAPVETEPVESEFYRPRVDSDLPFAEAAPAPAPPPVEPEVVDGEEVFVLYRPDGSEMTAAADAGVDYA